ncbi:CAMK/CAMKL/GIN4 protein kinase [Apiospora phragmitis]|uniref:non-specific serine/threonine protein kinase n=1 Tax=Apiospora phragmitis TaxID=2905665 RepID=A0ABR1TPR6_9PEZI
MKIYDIWENRSEIYLVLEYVDYGDLFEYINEYQCLQEDETVFFFRQIISALEYCHSFNICHRDLKPENILISSSGQVKIADFGMAAIHQGPTHWLQTACGSPHYAAPELVNQNRGYQGHKVDVWSAGVILRDLIRRMLQPNPDRRISIRDIWEHDLITAYDTYDDLKQLSKDDFQLDAIRQSGRQTQVALEDVDLDIVRQLKSMWHTYSEEKIIEELMCKDSRTTGVTYYTLLAIFIIFSRRRGSGSSQRSKFPGRPGRIPSRFTVISNVATDENGLETATDAGGTIRSYDPFKSSRIMGENEASHAKITVHRNGSVAKSSTGAVNGCRDRNGSGDGTPYKRNASRQKRGVDFSRVRRQPMKKRAPSSSGPASYSKGLRPSLQQFSPPPQSIDEASVESSPMPASNTVAHHDERSISVDTETPTPPQRNGRTARRNPHQWDTRPLPPAPLPTESKLHEIAMTKKRIERHHLKSNEFKGHVDRVVSNLNKLVPSSKKSEEDRRTVSAPIYSRYSTQWGKDTVPLPSIHEAQCSNLRNSSAPVAGRTTSGTSTEDKGLEYLARQENTIRVVQSPSAKRSPVKAPAPLNIRKCSAVSGTQVRPEVNLRQRSAHEELTKAIPEETTALSHRSSSGGMKKRSSWFKRTSKDKEDIFRSHQGSASGQAEELFYTESSVSSATAMAPTKKKSFSFAFWRNSKDEEQMKLSLAGPEFDESPSPEPNWLARLFRVKPASDHLCFNISRRRVRQEIAILLKEWRRYGIRDIQVDKNRNIVFGRVGTHNYLKMKGVSFAAEIMTVIEHGKRNPLSIVRFTQERGAASSFHKVVETMHAMFDVRNLLVTDKRKVKMMIKTLNA